MPALSLDVVRVIEPPIEVQIHPYLIEAPDHWDVFWTRPSRALNSLSLLTPNIRSIFHWDAPATFPRLKSIRIVSKESLWVI